MPNAPFLPAPAGHYGCWSCKTVKPLSDFYRSNKTKNGYSPMCRACKRGRNRAAKLGPLSSTLADRLWAKVDKNGPGGCWLFTGYTGRRGYGAIWSGQKVIAAHQLAWDLSGREPRGDLVLDHLCHERACVNPDHLRLVTQHQNSTQNNTSPAALNAQKTHCKQGHEYTSDNIALVRRVGRYNVVALSRVCLTCFPHYWMYAVIERSPRPRSRVKAWLGPQTREAA